MTYTNTEVTDAGREKFSFLVDDHRFKVLIKDARGTYLSQISFESDYLLLEIGVWGQGNELWITLTPLISKDIPAFDIQEVLNGITGNGNYFDEQVSRKTDWPIANHSFPQYFERCAIELRKYCEQIFAGDFSQWINITMNVLNHRIEQMLKFRQRNESLELSEEDKKELAPLANYLKSIDPDFSLSEVEHNILDKLTR